MDPCHGYLRVLIEDATTRAKHLQGTQEIQQLRKIEQVFTLRHLCEEEHGETAGQEKTKDL